MLPVTKHRIVVIPNSLALVAALVCLAFVALYDGVAPQREIAAEPIDTTLSAVATRADGTSPDGSGERNTENERARARGLDFTFFLFPSGR